MKGLFLYYGYTSNSDLGVQKKIHNQVELFSKSLNEDCEIKRLERFERKNKIISIFCMAFSKNYYDLSFIKEKKYAYIYIRAFLPNNNSVLEILKRLKNNNPNCKIIYEIPTYPYDVEFNTMKSKIFLFIDKLYRNKLHKYIDRVSTYSEDKYIYNIPTLKVFNGTNVNVIPISTKEEYNSNKINIIAVANFAFWHGYDRLIEGLIKYKNDNVIIHFVGDGPELSKYKKIVKEHNIDKQVLFYGTLDGQKLTTVFDNADIAICSLGGHRKNMYYSSELKSREYLSRGLPIVTSTNIDIIPNNYPYCLKVSEDDNPININEIIKFSNNIYLNKDRNEIKSEIRIFAENNCTMEYGMKNVIDFLSNPFAK